MLYILYKKTDKITEMKEVFTEMKQIVTEIV